MVAGKWTDLSSLVPSGLTPYFLTVNDNKLYLATFNHESKGKGDSILEFSIHWKYHTKRNFYTYKEVLWVSGRHPQGSGSGGPDARDHWGCNWLAEVPPQRYAQHLCGCDPLFGFVQMGFWSHVHTGAVFLTHIWALLVDAVGSIISKRYLTKLETDTWIGSNTVRTHSEYPSYSDWVEFAMPFTTRLCFDYPCRCLTNSCTPQRHPPAR